MAFERLIIDPTKMGRLPCIRGLVRPGEHGAGLARSGSQPPILVDFPDLTDEDNPGSARLWRGVFGLSARMGSPLAP